MLKRCREYLAKHLKSSSNPHGFWQTVNNGMQNLTFDMLNQAWNVLRTSEASDLQARLPMLQNPRALLMQRVSETPFVLTVMFRGFDQALTDMERGVPMTKRFLLDWIRSFGGQAQIQRGEDETSMVIRITKPDANQNPAAAIETPETGQHPQGPLANIVQVRNA